MLISTEVHILPCLFGRFKIEPAKLIHGPVAWVAWAIYVVYG